MKVFPFRQLAQCFDLIMTDHRTPAVLKVQPLIVCIRNGIIFKYDISGIFKIDRIFTGVNCSNVSDSDILNAVSHNPVIQGTVYHQIFNGDEPLFPDCNQITDSRNFNEG